MKLDDEDDDNDDQYVTHILLCTWFVNGGGNIRKDNYCINNWLSTEEPLHTFELVRELRESWQRIGLEDRTCLLIA